MYESPTSERQGAGKSARAIVFRATIHGFQAFRKTAGNGISVDRACPADRQGTTDGKSGVLKQAHLEDKGEQVDLVDDYQ
ncbi:MAG: hypothetical protein OEU50_14620, partial [Gammaproteobacteria bacterium]|nr:hypothetical protein [Gammaproteobacteria bacterium]